MQTDGHLVLYFWLPRGSQAVAEWAEPTSSWVPGTHAIMQQDGNLVLYDPQWNVPWASTSNPSDMVANSVAVLQNDGNLVIYTPGGRPVWASNTACDLDALGPTNSLGPTQMLEPGESLRSASGKAELRMQTDGNLVLYFWLPRGSQAVAEWAEPTSSWVPGTHATMQQDGNLVLYDPQWNVPWASASDPAAMTARSVLVLQDDGNLVIYAPGGRPTWASNTVCDLDVLGATDSLGPTQTLQPGEYIQSPGGKVRLTMQTSGSLVLSLVYPSASVTAWTSSPGPAGTHAIMQDDGNLVLYDPQNNVTWNSATDHNPLSVLVVQDDGNAVIYGPSGQALWATGEHVPATDVIATAGPDQAIDSGGQATLQGSASGGQGPYTYSWSPTTGLDNPSAAQPLASPSTTTTYALTVTDSLGQTATSSATVTVLPQPQHTLSLTGTGSGSISVNGTAYPLPWSGQFDDGTSLTLAAIPSTGYTFAGWSGDLSGATTPTTLTMDGDKSVSATFTLDTYALTVTGDNGSVLVNGASQALPYSGTFNYGDSVTLAAAPSAHYHFTGWSGDLSGTASPASLTIDGPKTVTVGYAIDRFTLSLSGTQGAVSVNGATRTLPYAGTLITARTSPFPPFPTPATTSPAGPATSPAAIPPPPSPWTVPRILPRTSRSTPTP